MVNNSQIKLDQLAVFSPTQEIGIRNLYALLVGIDKYKAPGNNLNGCVNDIEEVEKFIKNRLNFNSHIEKLLNEQATRQNVIENFENHLCKASKDDVVLFYFCGHGAQEEAGQELHFLEYEKEPGKKKLETIVCHDSWTLGEDGTKIRDLADKELRYLIAKVAKNEPHILVVFDCCHSSSGTRDTDRKEGVRRTDSRPPRAYEEFCFAHDPQIKQDLKNRKFPEGKHVFISACLHTETAKEITDLERGVFSYFLLKELNSLNATLSYNDLLREVSARVHGYRRDQTPQVEPIGMTFQELNEMSFLGDKEVIKPRDPYFILSHRKEEKNDAGHLIQEEEWVINGGAFLHLQKGSKLAVYREHSTADEMKNDRNKLGEIQITTVRVTESVVKFTSKPEPQGSIFYAVLTERQLPSVSFYLEGDANVLEQVKALLKDSPFVGIESDRYQTHHYRLYADKQQFRITDANDRLLVQPIEGYDVNLAVKQVEHIARWRKTREMENPSTTIPKNAIEIEIWHNGERLKDPHPRLEYQYKDGIWEEPIIQLKLKNTYKRSLYCTILDIADDYSVSFPGILPEGGDRSWIKLEPGQEYWAGLEEWDGHEPQDIPLEIPQEVVEQGVTEYQDLFKLIASTTQFNSSDFLQGSLSITQPPDRQVAHRQKLPNDDWITTQFSLTCVRPKDSVKLTPEAETVLSSGITIKAPPGLSASARFKTTKSATRSMSSMALPSLLEETETFQFTNSRSLEQGLDVLELQIDTSTINAVKPDSPMIISVDQPLQPNERIIAVAHDGQFYFPLGIGQAKNDKTEIKIEYLCDPQQLNSDEREISQAIQLCFRKVVLDNLGRKSSYAWLRKATVNRDGTVSYTDKGDVDTVKAAVAKAKNIVLYIHGIIGDTESMIPSLRHAKVNVNEQVKSVEELYDLVLAFDYESLNTPIEETAKILKNQLAAIGLEPNHGKTLHIVAHSMGGLVSRSFIEQENGNQVVSHLVMVGTPNGGSPWATVHDLATTLLSFGLNFSYVPLVPSLLKKLVEAMSVTLREMHSTKSSFFSELKTSVSSRCPYSIIAGSTALMNQAADRKNLLNALKNKLRRAIEFPFGDEENDIAVAVSSIIDVPQDGSSSVNILETIACDHLSYFRQAQGLEAIACAISQAFGYPPEPLPPSSSSSPPGPRPNPSPVSSGKTGAQQTGKSSTNTSTERTPSSSASTGGKSSAQKTASISPQTNPNHKTQTTKWFDTTHVVAIGINNYTRPIAKLENAVSDAEKICELFSDKSLQSREPVKHYKLLDQQATLDGIRQNLNSLKTEIKENDRLIFYFAGHGIALPEVEQNANKPQGYLIPQDAEYDKVESYLSMSEFIKSLSDIQCRHCLVILDCCYAGAIRWSLGQDRQVSHKKVFPSVLDLYIDSPAWQILTSAAEDQTANDVLRHLQLKDNNRDSNGKSNSPFVSFLEKGLKGKADICPQDGIITINELITYLDAEVEKNTNEAQKRQTPQLCDFPPEKHKRGKFVFLLKEFAEVKKDLPDDPEISDKDNPYQGLESYSEEDENLFFGRDKLIGKLSEHVQTKFFTVVLGRSGAGKSSLVKAGLVPTLKGTSKKTERSQQSNSQETTAKWDKCEIFRPGQLPAIALEEALEKLELNHIPDNTKRLLVIDQFEEVETQCNDEEEKNNFWKKLIEQLKNSSNKLHLVVTLRSDFELIIRNKFEDAIKKLDSEKGIDWVSGRFIVTDMEREELQDAIEKPAKEKAVFFTPNPDTKKPSSRTLVQELVKEVEGMPGALPLLSFALYTIYRNFAERYVEALKKDKYIKREITWDDYRDSLGGEGVPGSLTKRATEEYEQLPTDNHRAMLRRVMLRMISLQGVELARRQVPKWEWTYSNEEENDLVKEVIKRFSKARLIVEGVNSQGESYLEPAHDALVQVWDKFLTWNNENLQNILLQSSLIPAVGEWLKNEKANGFLWNNNPYLFFLKNVFQTENNWLNKIETEFFKASIRLTAEEIAKDKAQMAKVSASINPVDSLISAIEATCLNLEYNKAEKDEEKKVLTLILDSLRWTIKAVRECNIYRHESAVLCVAISPNGQWFVTGSYDGKLRRWNMNGNLIQEPFVEHKLLVNAVAISPDGQIIVSGSDDGILCLWNLQGELICEPIKSKQSRISAIAISHDGQWFISGDSHGSLCRWDINGNPLGEKITEHQGRINLIAISFDGKFILSGSEDKTVNIWEWQEQQIKSDTLKQEGICSFAISDDWKLIAIGSSNEVVSLLNRSNNQKILIPVEGKVRAIAFSPDGQWLAASGDSTIVLYNLVSERIQQIGKHKQPVTSIVFSPDGQLLMSASYDCTVRLWSIQDNYAAKDLALNTEQRHNKRVNSVEFLSDQTIASISNDGTIRLWNLEGRLVSKPVEIGCAHEAGKAYSLAVSSDRQLIVTYGTSFSLWKLNINEDVQLSKDEKFKISESIVQAVAFSPDGKHIVTSNLDRSLRLWDLEGNSISQPFKGHEGLINSIAFSPDGQLIVSGSDDGTLRLWNLMGKPLKEPFDGRGGRVNSVAFSPDGQLIASGSEDGGLRLWNLEGKQINSLSSERRHDGSIYSIAFSPDGQFIVSGSEDKVLGLWDLEGNLCGPPLQGHQVPVTSVAFSPNGKFIVSGDECGNLHLWLGGNWRNCFETVDQFLHNHPCMTQLIKNEFLAENTVADLLRKYI